MPRYRPPWCTCIWSRIWPTTRCSPTTTNSTTGQAQHMGKRKVFVKSDLATAQIEHIRNRDGRLEVPLEALPPPCTVVAFARHALKRRHFGFAPWYGVGIDEITYAC